MDVIIVGAGAAGLAVGIFLARRRPGVSVVALDGAAKFGAKILVSGGGRCNVTNVRVTPADYYGGNPNVLRRTLAAFSAEQTRAFFAEIGVSLHEEEYGKLFPDSNSAKTVVAALLAEADRRGLRVLPSRRVVGVEQLGAGGGERCCDGGGEGFRIRVHSDTGDGLEEHWYAKAVVIATGGLSLPKTGSDGFGYAIAKQFGHTIVPTTPALDPLLLAGGFHAGLSGVSHDVELTIRASGEKPVRIAGPMLWTHFGVSGPVALNAARFWNRARLEQREVQISANLLGVTSFEDAERELVASGGPQAKTTIHNALRKWLPARVAEAALTQLNVNPRVELGQLSRDNRRRVLHALLEWPLPVTGTRGYKFAEVTAGGVPLREINPATMESRRCPGLYFVGEVVDVDGRLGGFNFQWAWSSAWVAAGGI